MRLNKTSILLSAGLASIAIAVPAQAQSSGQSDDRSAETRTSVQPYIEVNQVLTAELTPGDDILTFTQIAAGVDANVQGRASSASLSLRYARNIGYGDQVDSDNLSGVARGSLAIVPRAVTLEAGGLASRTRIDGGGGQTNNPLVAEDAESQIYSVYAGPSITTRAGLVDIAANARVGYTRVESGDAPINQNGDTIDVFDESTTYNAQVRAGTRAGEALPIGIGVTAGAFQEDVSNLDQRVRDLYVRGDVTIPVSDSFAVVGGVGYEDVEVSSRDAVRDVNGDPVIGADGRFVTDTTGPRQIAFEVDGLIWDVGVQWNPSRRTSFSAGVGRRYDSTTYYGSLAYTPDSRSQLNVNVYDGLTSFGGALNNSLSGLSSDFSAARNALTGDFTGLVTGADGAAGGLGLLGSVRSNAFRNRGGQISYQRRLGRLTAAIAAGYDRRTFIGAENTVFEDLDGLTDESYYVNASLASEVGRSGSLSTNAYINWFTSEADNSDVTGYGASAAYNRSIAGGLSARAAVAVDYFDSEFTDSDFAAASALVGLRYDF
ncbi:MAG: preprotein translocase subunit YajC [Pseudomonadota bacterium]|nr:preprotein translocase subunit YajC [Pseudomonadota bacterium]